MVVFGHLSLSVKSDELIITCLRAFVTLQQEARGAAS